MRFYILVVLLITSFICSCAKKQLFAENFSFWDQVCLYAGLPEKYAEPLRAGTQLSPSVPQNLFKTFDPATDYVLNEMWPAFTQTVMFETIKRHEDELFLITRKIDSKGFQPSLYSVLLQDERVFGLKSLEQFETPLTATQCETFAGVLAQIKSYASPDFANDLTHIIKLTQSARGEKLRDALLHFSGFEITSPQSGELHYFADSLTVTVNDSTTAPVRLTIKSETGDIEWDSIEEMDHGTVHIELPGHASSRCFLTLETMENSARAAKSGLFFLMDKPHSTIPYRVVFRSPQQVAAPGTVSPSFHLQLQNKYGEPIKSDSTLPISLTSTSQTGKFSLSAEPFIPIESFDFPENVMQCRFYYRDTTRGTFELSATSFINPEPAVQKITIDKLIVEEFEDNLNWDMNERLDSFGHIFHPHASHFQAVICDSTQRYFQIYTSVPRGDYAVYVRYLDRAFSESSGTIRSYDFWRFDQTKPYELDTFQEKYITTQKLDKGSRLYFELKPDEMDEPVLDCVKLLPVTLEENVQVSVHANKDTFLLAEPVWITTVIQNGAATGPEFWGWGNYCPHVTDTLGGRLFKMLHVSYGSNNWPRLQPFERRSKTVNIQSRGFNFGRTIRAKAGFRDIEGYNLPAGMYNLADNFRNFYSDTTQFYVVQPVGQNLSAFELFTELSNWNKNPYVPPDTLAYWEGHRPQKELDPDSIVEMKKIVERLTGDHPNSAYTPSAIKLYAKFCQQHGDHFGMEREVETWYDYLYRQYPDEHVSQDALRTALVNDQRRNGPYKTIDKIDDFLSRDYSESIKKAARTEREHIVRWIERNRSIGRGRYSTQTTP